MKKFLILASLALLALWSCQRVEPTTINYKYKATLNGTVKFHNGNLVNPGTEVTIGILVGKDESNKDIIEDYIVKTNSVGQYTFSLNCKSKDGIAVKYVKLEAEYKDGEDTYYAYADGKVIKPDETVVIDVQYQKK
ncbi:MAG: hypothetical protein IKR69_06975 [Bacteroidales bacterium]|nr:hypothetical protein [Bacteroidales bacterium]